MKKVLIFLTLTVVLLMCFVSCDGQGEHTHSFGEWSVSKNATCTEDGVKVRYCDCGEQESETIPTVDHVYNTTYSFDNSFHWYVCTVCDAIKDKEEHEPFDAELCSVCDQLIGPTEGIVYDKSDDGTYAVVVAYNGIATKIRIADTYQGLPVTTIYDSAFKDNKTITTVIIPDSVTSIVNVAFRGCNSLTSVVIGDSVTSIGDYAFRDCSRLTSVVIGDRVTSIGNDAFSGCSGLTSIVIPDSVTSIGALTFVNCKSLTSVVIGDSVTSIGDGAFSLCFSLSSVVIGDSVTSIGVGAFDNCYSLISIVIPDGVTSIGNSAFSYCSGLTSIVIGDGVTSIGDNAFSVCSKLKDVYYTGSEEAWKAITIGSNNSTLSNATIHYNYVPEN